MKDDDSDDFFAEEIDEHEYEISATSKRPINWRRIELFKENKTAKTPRRVWTELFFPILFGYFQT